MFISYFIGTICSKKCCQNLEVQKKDKKWMGVQAAYRGRVQTNLQTFIHLMFDAEMGRPKYFRKFHHWLLIYFVDIDTKRFAGNNFANA